MLVTYLVAKRFMPRYAVPLTLAIAIVFVAFGQGFSTAHIEFGLTMPVFVAPAFSVAAAISLALPLFIVTMASQNLPGIAAIQACGFGDQRTSGGDAGIPISKVITLTGVATLVLAPFGAFALNLSAITAAICMGPEAHAKPERRYTAAVSCGAMYVLIGLLGAAIAGVLTAFPKELVAAIAGLALLGTIGSALHAALRDESHREAALIAFLVTLSGVTIGGVGSAFWGVVAGALALAVQHYGKLRHP
jgi:benzoate membrane transport protein